NKVPCKFELTTEAEYKQTTLINHFKNWHSDEEFKAEIKKLTDQLITRNDELISSNYEIESLKSQLISREKQVIELKEADKAQGKEIIQLKSQIQQQDLPVVPECVAEQIERVRNNNGTYTTLGLFDSNYDKKPDYAKWIEDNINEFMVACSVGYTVEKPQLFYLREKNTGYYLRKTGNDRYGITPHYSNDYNEKYMRYKFTQSEIDSMETGSYELVPVEDGE
ncbi:DUF1642 domain-containing protein, partial [Lactococcus lactis subsp. lactis]|uniref:DUF1642 domain-containing protein n=1 Tax=Lactococcus lactis TaxID=1358 RepID=UPI00223B5802